MHSDANYEIKHDLLISKVGKFVWITQASVALIGGVLTLAKVFNIAIMLATIGLIQILAAIFWAWIRFGTFEAVKEKRHLEQEKKDLQTKITTYSARILTVQQRRADLRASQQRELQDSLANAQTKYIRDGMYEARIEDESLPGIGEKLIERLAARGYTTALSIDQYISGVDGLGPVKTQTIIDWRNRILAGLQRTVPNALSAEAEMQIETRYEPLYQDCQDDERRSMTFKSAHEKSLEEVRTRLEPLTVVRFRSYVRRMLGDRLVTALLTGAVIIGNQLCLWPFSAVGALIDAIPTATQTPTITLTATRTFSATITSTPTITDTPTITSTPTITPTATRTFTPTRTFTFTPTITFTRTKTRTPAPYVPPVNPGTGGSNCHPSYIGVCLQMGIGDYDCAGGGGNGPNYISGPFQVVGYDEFQLDRNGDGWACEN